MRLLYWNNVRCCKYHANSNARTAFCHLAPHILHIFCACFAWKKRLEILQANFQLSVEQMQHGMRMSWSRIALNNFSLLLALFYLWTRALPRNVVCMWVPERAWPINKHKRTRAMHSGCFAARSSEVEQERHETERVVRTLSVVYPLRGALYIQSWPVNLYIFQLRFKFLNFNFEIITLEE